MAALTALALAAAGASLANTLLQKPDKAPKLSDGPALPAAPDPAAAALAQETALTRKKGKAAVPAAGTAPGYAGTLLTGPTGLAAPATTMKTLLGQ